MPKEKRERRSDPGALFVPAGILIGLGVGFLVDNIPAGLFIGLGSGFLVWALIKLIKN
jgi:hypothetical protein